MRRAAWLLAVLALAGCGGGGDEAGSPPATEPGTTAAAADGCADTAAPEPKPEGTLEPPSEPLEQGTVHRVRIETSCGAFAITLDPQASPKAAASFAALAESGFFDETTIHRVVPGFVIQGGDPGGTGTGGPGYTTVDPPGADTSYVRGTVAMAKAPNEPAGTAGSQFFVVTAQDAGLPPDYAVIGSVTEGMDVVERIEALGDVQTELPDRPVVVERMTLERG